MQTICIICARKNSTGLKNKSIKVLGGKPLIAHTIIQAKKSKIFDNIIVSTDSNKIQKISKKYGAESWFLRPSRLSTKLASKVSAIRHALLQAEKKYLKKFDIVFDLDVTSPLRKVSDIKNAFKTFKKNKSSVLFSVHNARRNPYFNVVERKNRKIKLVKQTKKIIHARQKAPKVYDMNASIYIWQRNKLLQNDNLFGSKTNIYVMPFERSIDIDEEIDFKIIEMLYKNENF